LELFRKIKNNNESGLTKGADFEKIKKTTK